MPSVIMILASSNLSNYINQSPPTESSSLVSLLTLIRVILVLIARAGFVLIQFGSVPTESVYDLLLQNVLEFSVSLTSYGLLGTFLSFGTNSYKGIIGYSPWIHTNMDLDNVLLGFCAAIIGSAIITTFLSSRLHFLGCAFLTLTYAGFFQPLLMHWMWHKDGWMNKMKIGNVHVDVNDNSGGLIIHVTSSCVGLLGSIFLGRRLLRLTFLDGCSLGAEVPSTIFMGYIFIVLGLIGMSLPTKISSHNNNFNYIGVALVNDFLSLAGGSLAAIILEFALWRDTFNYWVLLRCIQGCVSALIVISSSVDVCIPFVTFGISLVLTTLSNLCSKFIYKSSIEDYCNILSVHLLSGIWSFILQPIIAGFSTIHRKTLREILVKFSWHIICAATAINFTALFFSGVFLLLNCAGFLRNKIEDNCHRRSSKLSKNFRRCRIRRLFLLADSDLVLEPGNAGKIAECLNPAPEVADLEIGASTKLNFIGKVQEVNEFADGREPSQRRRKARNIYTMRNTPLTRRCDTALSSGDTGNINKIYKLEDLIQEKSISSREGLEGANFSPSERTPHYELNRFKVVNLVEEKLGKVCEGVVNLNSSPLRNKIVKRRSHCKLNKRKQLGILFKNRR